MQRRFVVGRRESGASTLGYAASFAIAAVMIIAVVWAARLTPVGPLLSTAVCKVSTAVGIGACADGPTVRVVSRPTRPTSTSPMASTATPSSSSGSHHRERSADAADHGGVSTTYSRWSGRARSGRPWSD